MKKIIFLIALCMICIFVLQHISSGLEGMKNIVLIEQKGSISYQQKDNIVKFRESVNSIDKMSIYRPGDVANIRTETRSARNAMINQVDGNFQDLYDINIIKGEMLDGADVAGKHKNIVLYEKTAIELFATTDCLNRKVTVGQEEYTIIGVLRDDPSPIRKMSEVNTNISFIPIIIREQQDDRYILMFRLEEGTAGIQYNALLKGVEGILGYTVNAENIDMQARSGLQLIKLVYWIMLLVTVSCFWSYIKRKCKGFIIDIRSEAKHYYLFGLIKANLIKLLIALGIILVVGAALYYIFQLIKFEPVIDPAIIPSRLVDTKELSQRLQTYFLSHNTSLPVVSSFHSYVNNVGGIITASGILLIFCYWRVVRKISNKVGVEKQHSYKASSTQDWGKTHVL